MDKKMNCRPCGGLTTQVQRLLLSLLLLPLPDHLGKASSGNLISHLHR